MRAPLESPLPVQLDPIRCGCAPAAGAVADVRHDRVCVVRFRSTILVLARHRLPMARSSAGGVAALSPVCRTSVAGPGAPATFDQRCCSALAAQRCRHVTTPGFVRGHTARLARSVCPARDSRWVAIATPGAWPLVDMRLRVLTDRPACSGTALEPDMEGNLILTTAGSPIEPWHGAGAALLVLLHWADSRSSLRSRVLFGLLIAIAEEAAVGNGSRLGLSWRPGLRRTPHRLHRSPRCCSAAGSMPTGPRARRPDGRVRLGGARRALLFSSW